MNSRYWLYIPKIVRIAILMLWCTAVSIVPVRASAVNSAASTPAGSPQPALYIVFEKHSDGTIAPVYYRPVELASPLRSLSGEEISAALLQPSREADTLAVSLKTADGQVLYRSLVHVSPWLRGEFQGATPDSPIDGHLLKPETVSFVVRVPQINGTTLVLGDRQFETLARIELKRLAETTPQIEADPSERVEVEAATAASNRIKLLVMGDGYMNAEAAKFSSDAAAITADFFTLSPYSIYKNYFTVRYLFKPSVQSGADHPPYSPSCSYYDATCCSDPEMLSDPLRGQMVNTAFDSRFCANGIHRLLVPSFTKVLAAASAVPDWDTILLIVNDTTYGGSGATNMATISLDYWAVDTAQHEYGHSFVDLADEYESAYPGYPSCSDAPGSSLPCEANVTDVKARASIKWRSWIQSTTLIPTPNNPLYDGLVGLFLGARYQSMGMYRSGYSCIMRDLGAPYCQVPSQAFVLRLYKGDGITPGISLIEPRSMSPATPTVYVTPGVPKTFHADTLGPVGGPSVQITWLKNGVPVPGITGNTYTPTLTTPGKVLITMRVKDRTTLVKPAMAGTLLQDQYTWTAVVMTKKPIGSSGALDGWVLESGENTNLGGSMNVAASTFILGDDARNRQYRTILSFDTSSLPDTAVIRSAVLRIKQSGTPTGINPFNVLGNLVVDIRSPYFGGGGILELGDFNAPAQAAKVGTFGKTPSSGWYGATLNATARANISKTGLTQLRLRFSLDDNNNHAANLMQFFSGNAGTSSYRPTLTILYYIP